MEKFLENGPGWLEKEQGERGGKAEKAVTSKLIDFKSLAERQKSHLSPEGSSTVVA